MDDDAARRRLIEAAERVAGSLADEDIPGWNTPDEILEWVRALRRASDRPILFELDENEAGDRFVQPKESMSG